MAFFNCEDKQDCVGLGILASIIIGVIAAFLRITGVITLTPAFLWVVFGIAVVYLVILVATYLSQGQSTARCARFSISTILTGILLSILLSVVLLAIPFATTSIIGAIVVGLLLLSFSLIISASACLVKYLAST